MEAMKISSKDSFEIGFNTACGLLAAGDCVKARSELEHAQRLGRHHTLTALAHGCVMCLQYCHLSFWEQKAFNLMSIVDVRQSALLSDRGCSDWLCAMLQEERRSWMRI